MEIRRIQLITLAIAALLLGSSRSPGQADNSSGAPRVWGGAHVSMVMSSENTTFEFDCAQGVIMSPIRPDASGDFTATGTYTPQRGGPIKRDSPPNDLPATYKGAIHGNTMTLEILLADKAQQPAPLTLKRGEAGRITKCR
jgi:hypothetical protein